MGPTTSTAEPQGKRWIQTYMGKKFYPLHPDPAAVDILDIAHALSNQCRFTGHSKRFYSVAEHSVRVMRRVRDLGFDAYTQLWALLHNASEAYLCDVASPVKQQPEFAAYREAEKRLQAVIVERFGLSAVEPEAVRLADRELLATEANALMAGGPHPEWDVGEPLKASGFGWDPEVAELRFLMEYRAIRKELGR